MGESELLKDIHPQIHKVNESKAGIKEEYSPKHISLKPENTKEKISVRQSGGTNGSLKRDD